MAKIHQLDFERSGVGKGIRMAALVLLVSAAVVMADHIFQPGTRPAAQPMPAKEVESAPALDGFALPESLKPTAADVTADGPPAF